LKHVFFPLLELKMRFLFNNLLLNLPLYIFVRIVFQKFSFFKKILLPIWPCAILCARAILCAPTVNYHSVCPLVGIGTLPTTPSLASGCAPPRRTGGLGGWAHSPAGEGLGESQSKSDDKKLRTLPTLWFYCTIFTVTEAHLKMRCSYYGENHGTSPRLKLFQF
jgi:hypothetical protein